MTSAFNPHNFDPVAALNAASAAAKPADPQTVMGAVGSAQSVHEAVANTQATVQFGTSVRMHDRLTTMEPSAQVAAWQGMNDSERSSLVALGYHPPNTDALTHSGAGGLFGHIWTAVASGMHTAADWAKTGAVDTLNVLGAPLRAVQHLGRAGHVIAEEGEAAAHGWGSVYHKASSGGATFGTGSQFRYLFDPGQWAKAWRQTTTGNTSIDPAIERHLTKVYGKQNVALAVRVLGAGSPTAVVQAAPPAQRRALTQKFQDPAFNTLLKEASNGRMSIGRFAVGSRFLNQHPEAGKVISGGIDAAYDFAATPLRVVGKASEAARVARFGIDDATVGSYLAGDASRMDDLLRSSSVQQYVRKVGSFLEEGDYSGLGKFDPRLDSITPQLAAEGIDSAAGFHQWLASEAGLGAVLTGNAARLSHGVAIMPHLTLAGWLKAGVKEALQTGLDRLADGKVPGLDTDLDLGDDGVGGVGDISHQHFIQARAKTLEDVLSAGRAGGDHGIMHPIGSVPRLIRRLSTLIQTKPYIDIGESADVANVRRAAQGILPAARVDDLVNIFVDGDQGVRYRIVKALRHQMLHMAGAYNTADGADAADRFLGALEDAERSQAYSVTGIDTIVGEDGNRSRTAILTTQLANRIAMPLPADVRRIVAQHSMLGALRLKVDTAMYLWRSMILDRLGFAARASLTENLGRLLRTGPRKFIGSYLANGASKLQSDDDIERSVAELVKTGDIAPADADAEIAARKALAVKPLLPYHPIERGFAMLSERVPPGIRPLIDTPAKLYGTIAGVGARKFVRAAQGLALKALGLQDYIDSATRFFTHQPVAEAYADMIDAGHGTEGYIWTPGAQIRAVRDDATGAAARFKASVTHGYSEATGHDPLWRFKWQFALDQAAQDRLARAVLESIDKTPRTQERAVLRVLEDPDFAETKARFARNGRLGDGRVAGVDATWAEADRDWARRVVRHVNTLVRSSDAKKGPILHDLVSQMLDTGRGPSEEVLDAIDQAQLPAGVYGPDLVQVHGLENLFSKSFETVVGKPMNWMTRQPHFIANYAEAEQQLRPFAERMAGGPGDNAEKLLSDLATQRAVNKTTPYIHNPTLRTQFEDQHRVLFPFLFAQRQFLQRWGRTILDSPDTIRKIQLTMNGLRSVGFIRKDQNGTTFFYYPLTQYPQELVTKVLTRLGIKASVPMAVPFTGEVKYMMPGLDNPVTPNVGPFAAVSMKGLAKLFPELNGFEQGVLQQGASTPMWQQFTPTVINRLWNALGPQQAGSELASTTMQAIKYLDAAGYTLPDNATPADVEQYVSRVQNWARSLLVIRAALGFALPATPTATLDGMGLDKRFQALLTEMPYDTAVAAFIKEHPDATAYTVSETQNGTDGYTPATAATVSWLNSHIDFARAHPLAAAWFVPRSGQGFTPAAYREQLALGMRHYRTLTTFMDQVIMARASTAYATTYQRYNAAYNRTTTTDAHERLVNWWHNWKASFFKRNPIFGNYITSEGGHIRRLQTIQDVEQALTSPDVPDSPLVAPMREMLGVYRKFADDYVAESGLYATTSTAAQKQLQADMETWGTAYVKAHPGVKDFWNTVMLPEVQDASA